MLHWNCVCVSVCTETKYNRYWWSSNKQHIRHCNLIAFHILQSTITVLHMLQHFYRFEHTESGWVLHVSLSVCTGASSSCKCARGFSWPWWNKPRIGFIRILPCGPNKTLKKFSRNPMESLRVVPEVPRSVNRFRTVVMSIVVCIDRLRLQTRNGVKFLGGEAGPMPCSKMKHSKVINSSMLMISCDLFGAGLLSHCWQDQIGTRPHYSLLYSPYVARSPRLMTICIFGNTTILNSDKQDIVIICIQSRAQWYWDVSTVNTICFSTI